jgi:hypothetical protein
MKTCAYYYNIPMNSSLNEKYLRQQLWRKSKHTFVFIILFYKNRAVYVVTWTNVVRPDRPQITV